MQAHSIPPSTTLVRGATQSALGRAGKVLRDVVRGHGTALGRDALPVRAKDSAWRPTADRPVGAHECSTRGNARGCEGGNRTADCSDDSGGRQTGDDYASEALGGGNGERTHRSYSFLEDRGACFGRRPSLTASPQ